MVILIGAASVTYIECEYTMITDKTSQMQKIIQQHGYM